MFIKDLKDFLDENNIRYKDTFDYQELKKKVTQF